MPPEARSPRGFPPDFARRRGGARRRIKALLYEHFSSKRELYVAMLEMHVHELLERISGAVAGADPGEPRMRAGLEAFFGFVEERRGAWRIMFRNSDDPDVSVRLDRLRDEVAAAIVQLMSEEAASKGIEFPKMPQTVEMIAQQLVGAMQSLADWWDLHRDVPRDEVIQVAMDFAWMGQDQQGASAGRASPLRSPRRPDGR